MERKDHGKKEKLPIYKPRRGALEEVTCWHFDLGLPASRTVGGSPSPGFWDLSYRMDFVDFLPQDLKWMRSGSKHSSFQLSPRWRPQSRLSCDQVPTRPSVSCNQGTQHRLTTAPPAVCQSFPEEGWSLELSTHLTDVLYSRGPHPPGLGLIVVLGLLVTGEKLSSTKLVPGAKKGWEPLLYSIPLPCSPLSSPTLPWPPDCPWGNSWSKIKSWEMPAQIALPASLLPDLCSYWFEDTFRVIRPGSKTVVMSLPPLSWKWTFSPSLTAILDHGFFAALSSKINIRVGEGWMKSLGLADANYYK